MSYTVSIADDEPRVRTGLKALITSRRPQWRVGGLFRDGDPISAARRTGANRNDEFTCPATPLRRKYKALPAFTRLIGGGYFFLPGLRALRYIAGQDGAPGGS